MKKYLLFFLILVNISSLAQNTSELRGVWLTNVDSKVLTTDENITEAMNFLSSIGINVVFPVVYNKGYTLYPSKIMDSLFNAKTIPDVSFSSRDFLERLIIEAHRVGIEVIPWFEFGFSTSYSENGGHIIAKFPDWALKDNSGNLVVKNGFDWMSGINPEVQDFMLSLIKEVIENYDVDGIQGDDRLPAMPVEGGYDNSTVQIYKSEHSGTNPPTNYTDAAWKKWRADKLSQFLLRMRETVKSYGNYLLLSVSPTPYYWGYDQYLQDSKTWAQQGLCDQIIPQLYQYNLADYNYALNKTWTDVGQYSADNFFAGVLMQVGNYTISSSLLSSMISANRAKNVKGETYFFYEGLRKNSNELGNFLATNYYSQPAILPNRNGGVFRPKAKILNENSPDVLSTGNWEEYSMKGYDGKILRTSDTVNLTSLKYNFQINDEAFYDVYSYRTPNTPWTKYAQYKLYSGADSISVIVDQSDLSKKGWQKLGSVYLEAGQRTVVKLDNQYLESGKYLVADAVMIMINRKLSPNVIVSIKNEEILDKSMPKQFLLNQNYPNPFNPSTTISYSIPKAGFVQMNVYNSLGQKITTLVNDYKEAGVYNMQLSFSNLQLSSGIYFYTLQSGQFFQTRKMTYIK
ncbi:MAG: hypothetical protein Fur0015_02370 [Ignavibacteriales bacterium]